MLGNPVFWQKKKKVNLFPTHIKFLLTLPVYLKIIQYYFDLNLSFYFLQPLRF